MGEYQEVNYTSLTIFTREIEKELRSFSDDPHDLATPCDGELTAYPITADSFFFIKILCTMLMGCIKINYLPVVNLNA